MVLTEGEIGYIAGLIDGEGHISVGRRYHYDGRERKHPYYLVIVALTSTHLGVLEWVEQRCGGKIYKKSNGTPDGKNKPHWQLVFMGNRTIRRFLEPLVPYLIIKADQARIALEFLAIPRYTRDSVLREEYYLLMQSLNARGVKERKEQQNAFQAVSP